MISKIQIENFKSISNLSLELGRVTVLIGENGSGKSNILEAITFAAAASANKLDDEFLATRGIRVTEKEWMMPGFTEEDAEKEKEQKTIGIAISSLGYANPLAFSIERLRGKEKEWWHMDPRVAPGELEEEFRDPSCGENYSRKLVSQEWENLCKVISDIGMEEKDKDILLKTLFVQEQKKARIPEISEKIGLREFMIYAPENTSLRKFEEEGSIKPLGTKGEGLLKLLQAETSGEKGVAFVEEIKSRLALLGWFEDLQFPTDADEMRGRLRIQDRWASSGGRLFDQRSANEGFLYLLFYFVLFASRSTPSFFAIDNIDNALNPKLCSAMMRQVTEMAKNHNKQVICTTHNPSILDGLNLHDDEQRLYVVRRDSEGRTIATRVAPPRQRPDGKSTPLSAAFMSGLLGGLPDHF